MFKGPKAYEQVFGSKDIDAVYIATPPYFHPDHLEAAWLPASTSTSRSRCRWTFRARSG
jgi:hypothetical protein